MKPTKYNSNKYSLRQYETLYHHNRVLFINLVSQVTGTFKCNNLSWFQHHSIAGCRIPGFSFFLFLCTKFTEVAY